MVFDQPTKSFKSFVGGRKSGVAISRRDTLDRFTRKEIEREEISRGKYAWRERASESRWIRSNRIE